MIISVVILGQDDQTSEEARPVRDIKCVGSPPNPPPPDALIILTKESKWLASPELLIIFKCPGNSKQSGGGTNLQPSVSSLFLYSGDIQVFFDKSSKATGFWCLCKYFWKTVLKNTQQRLDLGGASNAFAAARWRWRWPQLELPASPIAK